jgi:hypothetical protein
MTGRAGLEVDTLTIRIPMRLERGGGRKLIMTPKGAAVALTCLAPDIVEAILDGRQPRGLRLAEMLGNGPLDWNEQRRIRGFSRGYAPPRS